MPKTKQPPPAFLANARAFYGEAFDHKTNKAIARSMTEWAELDEDEQSFAQAHLLYMNLQAQAATQRLLTQVRDLLDEVAESLTAALEASLAEPAEEEGGDGEGEDGVDEVVLEEAPRTELAAALDEGDGDDDTAFDPGDLGDLGDDLEGGEE